MLDYLLEMKKAGVVRHIGLSSHTPELAQRILDTGLVEQLMFSINPAYDYQHGEYAIGSAGERMDLYRRCEAEGIGISVMKPYSGGQLLDDQYLALRQGPDQGPVSSSTPWTSPAC